jgi:NAD(P)-dependent dehydrogenase (short-subunit alcohol dehydrogenase family)
MRLEGKVVLVTGGGRGIGAAIVRRFAAEGAVVELCGRNVARGRKVADEVTAAGGRAAFRAVDCANEDEVAAWVDGAAAEHGRIDGIVNNAGIAPADLLENVSVAVWREVIDCNVTSMFLVTRAAIKHLRAAGGGSIVNLGSTFGVVGAGGSSVYSLTKAAAISLSQSLALELAPDRIRVNALCPGGTQTEFLEDWFVSTGDPGGTRDWLVGRLPIGRLGQPDEQAAAALFLMSDDASFVTGHALLVDGGYTAQ